MSSHEDLINTVWLLHNYVVPRMGVRGRLTLCAAEPTFFSPNPGLLLYMLAREVCALGGSPTAP